MNCVEAMRKWLKGWGKDFYARLSKDGKTYGVWYWDNRKGWVLVTLVDRNTFRHNAVEAKKQIQPHLTLFVLFERSH